MYVNKALNWKTEFPIKEVRKFLDWREMTICSNNFATVSSACSSNKFEIAFIDVN